MTPDPRLEIASRIRKSRRIAVTSHLRPDGDSLCTGLALSRMGDLLGKEVSVVNKDNTPFPFCHFPDAGRIRIGQIDPSGFDTVILLECADVSRSGQEHLGGAFKINIDHHYSNTPYADINWIDPGASAVGEMVFDLSRCLDITLTPEIADHLYCAIFSDTGSFQFSNTTAKALETCTSLTRLGASPIRVSERLLNNNPPEKIKLLGQVLSTLTMNTKGNIAIISMFQRDLEALGLKEIDTEDITTLARSIKGTEMVMFFKEMGKDTFRISLRSKGRANAARVAEHFGGGGHVHASGFTVYGPYERLIREVPKTVQDLLDADPAGASTASE
ncbi:MAG: bifunctional oligoribonuclease/PAP phosphatase NrnA [Candidatus Aminicenantales bacterium]